MKDSKFKSKIFYSFADFKKLLFVWRNNNESIVFTNGCFDIIHKGHTDYLYASAQKGDRLVIGLNSDASVRELKGKNRPICNQTSRANVLASMSVIDAVILFNQKTPLDMIKKIKPDVLIKGSDYTPEKMDGADYVKSNGGKIMTVAITNDYSTSAIIKKIKFAIYET